jgi:CDP-diacylglycerol--glycerol-3-phosphate 3-phosphatidyltransferase
MKSYPQEAYLHDRILDKLILWMIPMWVTPNSVTWLRIILTPIVLYVNYIQNFSVGIPLFLFTAFTDAIDGSLARTRGQITNFGKMFDPLADKLLIGSMLVLLLFQNVDRRVALLVVGIEIIFIVLATVRVVTGHVGQANVWGKIKMVLQVFAVFLILIGLTFSNPFLFAIATWVFGAAVVFAIISLFFHGI